MSQFETLTAVSYFDSEWFESEPKNGRSVRAPVHPRYAL